MPAKLFSELQDQLAYELGFSAGRTGLASHTLTVVKERLNQAQELIFEAAHWTWSRKRRVILTTARYNTGTVTVTQNSTTITGSGTTFTSAMAGRYFVHGGTAYKILSYTSATVITLEVPYVDATAAGESYSICEPEYILPYDVREIVKDSVRQIGEDDSLTFMSEQEFNDDYPNPSSVEDPPTIYRLPEYSTSSLYSTGSVSMTNASTAVTCTASGWDVQMIGRGFRVDGQSEIYEIANVTSTSVLALKRKYGGATTASTGYEIDSAPCLKIWLYPFLITSRGIEFWYYKKPFPLINDADIPDMPPDMHQGILFAAEWLWYKFEGVEPTAETNAFQSYNTWLFQAKRKQKITQDRVIGLKPHWEYALK